MLKFNIELSDYPENPLRDDRLSKIVTWHNKYELGDEQPDQEPKEWLRNMLYENGLSIPTDITMDGMLNMFKECIGIIQPVHLYEHSGKSLSLEPFSCKWDSGQIGFAYIRYVDAELEGIHDDAMMRRILEVEFNVYNYYIVGECYDYNVWSEEECQCCGQVVKEDICSGYCYFGDHNKSGIYDDIYLDLTYNGYEGSFDDMIKELE